MPNDHRIPSHAAQLRGDAARHWTLAAARTHGAHRDDGHLGLQLGAFRAQQPEISARGHGPRSQVHQGWIRNVAVGKHRDVHLLVANDLLHPVLFQDRNALRVSLACKFRRIMSSSNVGDLGCGEGDYLKFRLIAKNYVEVMKISSSSSQDEDSFHFLREASLDP